MKGEAREVLGLWRGPGAPGEGRGVTGKGPCSGVPEINDSHRARSCGAPHPAVGLVPASGAQPLPEAPPRGRPRPRTFISRTFLSLFRSMRHSSDMHFSRLAARWRYSIS